MSKQEGWTVGFIRAELRGKLQFWLIQDGQTNGGPLWQWGTYISSQDAKNHNDALKVAQSRYNIGNPSEIQKKSEKAA